MALTTGSTEVLYPYAQHSTRDRILMHLYDDWHLGMTRGPTALGERLGLSKGAVGDQLKILEREQLVVSVKLQGAVRGQWQLTKAGRRYAEECKGLRSEPERGSVDVGVRERGLPYYGRIAAGTPSLMPEIPLDTYSLLGIELDPERYFVMEVDGESMLNEHIQPGDIAIFQRVDRWKDIKVDTIVAAAVPADAAPDLPDWLDRSMQALRNDENIDESSLVTDHVTLKKIDVQLQTLVGRYGAIHTTFAPIGVLVQIIRTYDDGIRYQKS